MRISFNSSGILSFTVAIICLTACGTAFIGRVSNAQAADVPITTGVPGTLQAKPDANRLAIRDRFKIDTVDIRVQPLRNLNFMTKVEVLELRHQAVSLYQQLIVGRYSPSDSVFGQIVDGLPWVGILGAFWYGPGDRCVTGPSLQSESILNPYLLVLPEFRRNWRRATIPRTDDPTWYVPLFCMPRHVRWFPRKGRVEVLYGARCLQRNRIRMCSLAAYNAKDFNLNYVYVSFLDSRNVRKKKPATKAYKNPQFIHQGNSCGYPGGCNNLSPATPFMDNIEIVGWPCKIVLHLWTSDPVTVDKVPDVKYIIYAE